MAPWACLNLGIRAISPLGWRSSPNRRLHDLAESTEFSLWLSALNYCHIAACTLRYSYEELCKGTIIRYQNFLMFWQPQRRKETPDFFFVCFRAYWSIHLGVQSLPRFGVKALGRQFSFLGQRSIFITYLKTEVKQVFG